MSDAPLHVELERSGGFAGITTRVSLDTSALSPAEAAEVEGLVERADLRGLARSLAAEPPAQRGADRFQYELTVSHGGERYSVELPESAATPEVRQLISRVTQLGKRG
jgi:hypothetical protein